MKWGDVALVEFPYVDGGRGKFRPALIIQHDRDNARLANTIVAMISGNTRHAGEPSQVLIDPSTSAGQSSGLNGPSVVKGSNLYTIRQKDVQRILGHLSQQSMHDVVKCLKSALNLP